MSWTNPIISGFAPDPSLVLVDGTFFLVNSSFHIFPGLPIYASKNLKSWTQIGNAINRPNQLSLDAATTKVVPLTDGSLIAVGGLYAPTIRYHRGTFYIICTNISNGRFQNFYITCRDIWKNEWSHPIEFEFHGIDTSLFFDDDGKVYVQGSHVIDYSKQPSCIIKQFEIDIETGKQLTEQRDIWEGHAKIDPEGPHIYKRGSWYYLMIAEGGTFEHHRLSIARSRSVWGPYESYEKNPILTADGTRNEIQNVGHGELFQDEEGLWWAVVLGVRDHEGRYPMGRETFLTPVTWPVGGWPDIQPVGINMERTAKTLALTNDLPAQPEDGYVYIRDPIMKHYKVLRNKRICLTATDSTLSTPCGTTTFVGLRQRDIECSATATLILSDVAATSGLAIYKDDYRHAEIFFDVTRAAICFTATCSPPSGQQNLSLDIIPGDQIQFAIHATQVRYEFLFRQSTESDWHSLSTLDTKLMTGKDFTGTLFGVYASGHGEATFEDFDIKQSIMDK